MAGLKKIDAKLLSVGIVGYTGATGTALSAEILEKDVFKSTTLIGRRHVEYKEDYYKKAIWKLVDFEKLSEYDDAFKNLDVVYCCLGTTRLKAGADGFRRVDYDYVLETAKVALKNGCKQFHLVSSSGADKNSMLLYPKTKGEIEEAVGKLGFERYVIYRPKFLIAPNRDESRIAEKVGIFLTKPFQILTPTLITTPITTLAKALVSNTIFTKEESKAGAVASKELIDNARIFELAEQLEKSNK